MRCNLKLLCSSSSACCIHPFISLLRGFIGLYIFTAIRYIYILKVFDLCNILAVTTTPPLVERLHTLPVHTCHKPLSCINIAYQSAGDGAYINALQFGIYDGVVGKRTSRYRTFACSSYLKKPRHEVFAMVHQTFGSLFHLATVVTAERLRCVFHLGEKPHLVRDLHLVGIVKLACSNNAVEHTRRVDDVGITREDVLKVNIADAKETLVFETFAFGFMRQRLVDRSPMFKNVAYSHKRKTIIKSLISNNHKQKGNINPLQHQQSPPPPPPSPSSIPSVLH
nr:MAG TPA: hypothetical protein [Caudoviricetes sp.]